MYRTLLTTGVLALFLSINVARLGYLRTKVKNHGFTPTDHRCRGIFLLPLNTGIGALFTPLDFWLIVATIQDPNSLKDSAFCLKLADPCANHLLQCNIDVNRRPVCYFQHYHSATLYINWTHIHPTSLYSEIIIDNTLSNISLCH